MFKILKKSAFFLIAALMAAQGQQVAVTTRTVKGSALTTAEMDANFNTLQYAANGAGQTWGRNDTTTTALTWGYYGGTYWTGSAWGFTANGTVALTASATNYVERTSLGVVSANTSGWTATNYPMAKVITGTATITSWSDYRFPLPGGTAANPMSALGDVIYGGTAGAETRLAGNITTTNKFLAQVGNGAISAAPSWAAIVSGDLTTALTTPPAIGGATPAAGTFTTLISSGGTATATLGGTSQTVTGTSNGILDWRVTNSSNGASATAQMTAINDVASSISMVSQSSAKSGSRFGVAVAGFAELTIGGASSNGFILGVSGINKPIDIGINTSLVAQFTGGTLASDSYNIKYTTDATSTTAASFTTAGGLGVLLQSYFGDQLHMAASTTTRASESIPVGTAPTSPVSGDLWHDTTQKARIEYVAGIKQALQGVIFTQTADKTFNNTTTETSLIGTGVGTVTLPANFWAPGKTVRIIGMGYLSDTATPTFILKSKIGAVATYTSATVTMPTLTGNQYFYFKIISTCRTTGASGTVFTTIESYCNNGGTAVQSFNATVNTGTSTVDTTASSALDVTGTWGTANASNAATTNTLSVEVLN